MPKCALIVDIIIGELQVLDISGVGHPKNNPLCPVIAVQISKGPLLQIPFLTPESINSHLQYINNGHQFLPLEVEESYINGGKFVFQRGKSCLYTVPVESLQIGRNDDCKSGFNVEDILSQNIIVIVMNGLQQPPDLFGKCTLQLESPGVTDGHLAGKVELKNHVRNLVGYLTLSISLRYLGEDVALHAVKQGFNSENCLLREHFSQSIPICNENKSPAKNEEVNNKNVKPAKGLELMTSETISPHLNSTSYGIEHSFKRPVLLDNLVKNTTVQHESSEEIASRIAALMKSENSPEVKENADKSKVLYENQNNYNQPGPILYFGRDAVSERIWNEKMKDVGSIIDVGNFDNVVHNLKSEVGSFSQSVDSPRSESSLPTLQGSTPRKTAESHDNPECLGSISKHSKDTDKKAENVRCETLKRPKGWLRSSPVAPRNNKAVHPRLTRTSLLRRAKLDPELAHQLHTEVDYQIKQKLQLLEKNFKDELTDVKKRKVRKTNGSLLVSVGCQANESNSKVTLQKSDHLKDFAQQTILCETATQFTQAPVIKDSGKKTDVNVDAEKRRLSKIELNRTFDISDYNQGHFTEYDDDFEVSSNSKLEPDTVSELSAFQKSSEFSEISKSVINKNKELLCLSTSKSKPKNHSKDKSRAKYLSNSKVKASNSDLQLVGSLDEKFPSPNISQRTSDVDDRTLIESGASSSYRSISEVDIPHRSESDVYSASAALSSEASEVSEASNLSKEVYQEIMRGKKADVLLRNGSQGLEKMSETSNEKSVRGNISSVSTSKNVLEQSVSDDVKSMKAKFIGGGETFSFGEIVISGDDVCDSAEQSGEVSYNIKTTRMKSLYKEKKIRELYKTYTKSEPSILDKPNEIPYSSGNLPNARISPLSNNREDEDSTVSNISARIAALLVPKQLEVAILHTDSISSYMPSSVSDTLSSLSDLE